MVLYGENRRIYFNSFDIEDWGDMGELRPRHRCSSIINFIPKKYFFSSSYKGIFTQRAKFAVGGFVAFFAYDTMPTPPE